MKIRGGQGSTLWSLSVIWKDLVFLRVELVSLILSEMEFPTILVYIQCILGTESVTELFNYDSSSSSSSRGGSSSNRRRSGNPW